MTDAPDLTPEQDAVRRLLADARHDGTTPPEVVTRLDETLASLVAERGDAPTAADDRSAPAPVVDLAARRRRRAGIGLLAAAAVVVAGVAIGQGLPGMSGSDTASESAAGGDTATSQERDAGAQEDSAGGGADGESGAAETSPETLKSTAPAPVAGYPTLSTFAADLDDQLLDLRSSDASASAESGSTGTLAPCDLRGIGQGRRLVAEVDGQLGLVVFRRPDGAAQQADLYVCGDPEPVRTLILPAP